MITGWMFRALPGPRPVRVIVLASAYAVLGWLAWRYVFPQVAEDWLGTPGLGGVSG